MRESIGTPDGRIVGAGWCVLRLLTARTDQLTTRVLIGDSSCRAAVSNQTQISVAGHELVVLLTTAVRSRACYDMIHHALQLAGHQRVLRGVRLKRVGVEAVGLICGGVELSVEQTRRQHRVDRAIAAIATVAIGVLILVDAKVLVAIDAAKVGRVGRQQIVLHRRLSLRRVAQAPRTVLTRVQVVVVVALILVVARDDEVVGRAVGRDRAGVVGGANASRVHQRLVGHLSRRRWRADEAR